jgi:hypothetical protein
MTLPSSVARLWLTTDATPDSGRALAGATPALLTTSRGAALLELNLRNYGVGLEVKGTGKNNNNTIRYFGNGSHSTDVGAIQTSQPVPSCSSVYYYEITVLDEGERGYISLGFADRDFKLNRQCGCERRRADIVLVLCLYFPFAKTPSPLSLKPQPPKNPNPKPQITKPEI